MKKDKSGMTDFNLAQEKKKVNKRFISFDERLKPKDHEAIVMGAMGCYTMRYIQEKTGLHLWQVAYRLAWAGISLKDIRNGKTVFTDIIRRKTAEAMEERLRQHLRKHL